MTSPGIPGTYAQLAAHARRALTRSARQLTARALRAAARATCPCGTCAP